MFYSKSTGGFYDTAIHGDNIPADAVEISEQYHLNLFQGQAAGKVIVPDNNGYPVLQDAPLASSEQIWAQIKAERDKRKEGGVLVEGKWFHSDDASRIQQLSLVLLGDNIPKGLQWKTMDGSFIEMDANLAKKVFDAQVLNDQTLFAIAQQHKAGVDASVVPSNYDYSTGWPKIYGEQL